ncbi:pilus assembly protein [Jeongeupia wiesaeckerbachi]|uniref:TadE/TadG family type IV pilus assembly protein n=1 Tax=Jeongeupia wiesaeckerbachi TaxID=3051218 RepID=UPI003D8006FE
MTARKACRGAITVEFALVAPLVLFVLVCALDLARVAVARILLERSLYEIGHELRLARGEGLDGIAARVLDANHHLLFDPDAVEVRASHADDLAALADDAGEAGGGGPGQVVELTLEAELGGVLRPAAEAPPYQLRTLLINEPEF